MSFSTDRDPTPGELRIMFESIMNSLKEVKATMATKEFVNTKFDSYNERMRRLENDLKQWEVEATLSQAKIRQEILDSIREHREFSIAEHDEIHNRIDNIERQKTEIAREKRSRTVALSLALVGAGLSLIVSVVSATIINSIVP